MKIITQALCLAFVYVALGSRSTANHLSRWLEPHDYE
jgi:hypothetical protein